MNLSCKDRHASADGQPHSLRSDVILSCGVDLVEFTAFARVLEVGGKEFLEEIYTIRELDYCRGRLPQLAARFAAKEAVAKALGSGIRGIDWTDMEVVSAPHGAPCLALTGRAASRAAELGFRYWTLSMSHSESAAVALVIALADPERIYGTRLKPELDLDSLGADLLHPRPREEGIHE